MVPSLFIAHGSPMIAVEDSEYGTFLDRLGQTLPRPKAVVIFSAHWESPVQCVTYASSYSTIYDFGGFPDALYQIHYPAPGSPDLAENIQGLLAARNIPVQKELERGLDHGAWTILKRLYPTADVPVVAMSVNQRLSPQHQFEIGAALASLREENVLVLGSGVTVHNFQILGLSNNVGLQKRVKRFERWLQERLQAWDLKALFDYENQAPDAHLAVPPGGREHFAPLYYAMGAAGPRASVHVLYSGWMWNVMANSVFQFTETGRG